MNTKLSAIFGRRSVRRFTAEAVTEEEIRGLLEAGMAAPSARDADHWSFVVVRDRGVLNDLSDAFQWGKMLAHAPLAIMVCSDGVETFPNEMSYMLQGCCASVENILIAASLLGLGSVWIGTYPNPELVASSRRILDIPEGIIPIALIAIGHPVETPSPRTRYTDTAVHIDRW